MTCSSPRVYSSKKYICFLVSVIDYLKNCLKMDLYDSIISEEADEHFLDYEELDVAQEV